MPSSSRGASTSGSERPRRGPGTRGRWSGGGRNRPLRIEGPPPPRIPARETRLTGLTPRASKKARPQRSDIATNRAPVSGCPRVTPLVAPIADGTSTVDLPKDSEGRRIHQPDHSLIFPGPVSRYLSIWSADLLSIIKDGTAPPVPNWARTAEKPKSRALAARRLWIIRA